MIYKNNLLQFWKKMPSESGFEYLEKGQLTCIKGPSKLPWSHYAWGEITEDNIEAVSHFFKGLPLIWYLHEDQIANAKLCEQIDISRLGTFPDMVIKLSEWKKSSWDDHINVEVVKSSEQLQQWIFVCSKSFDMNQEQVRNYAEPIFEAARDKNKHITFFLGSIDGKPAGVSINCGGAAQSTIIWVGVLEEYRRQGLGRAMVESCLEVAKNAGSTSSMLNSFAAGKHLYESIGFKIHENLVVFSNNETPCLSQKV